ncbi:MAG TPA: RT0821/Lpp0805 family surface protein [Micropepsaceae bacterium]|nr:RT0821/Lpp0805 family surface protein [Micropepsaceae bacterium]
MQVRSILLIAASAAIAFGTNSVSAQPGPDPYGYYSQYDHDGFFDRDGHYHRIYAPPPPPPAPPPAVYEQGRYEGDCHQGNAVAGTVFGALAGGLLGSAASHGNGGAVVGGAVLGGLLGNTISREIDCDDQPYAFNVYATGLNGEIGRRYDWHHGEARGEFTPIREFRRRGEVCREFRETSWHGRESHTHNGIACRRDDGHWRFD